MSSLGMSTEQYTQKADVLWEGRWDYSQTVYLGARVKSTIICTDHGPFQQDPSRHLAKHIGCRECYRVSRIKNFPVPKISKSSRWVNKAQSKLGDKYDYSITEYKNYKTHVDIICRKHGPFRQLPKKHLDGVEGCRKCFSTKDYVSKAKEVHGDRWDYSITEYAGYDSKISFGCIIHGEQRQQARRHLRTEIPCKHCRHFQNFMDQVDEKPWKDKFDYSVSVYWDMFTSMTIKCIEHGEFKQTPRSHLTGWNACSGCNEWFWDLDRFLQRAKEVWGDRWDYSSVVFTGLKSKVDITCRIHGIFSQTPDGHLAKKIGCVGCSLQGTSHKEQDLINFIKELGFNTEDNVRGLLGDGRELDVYIPSKCIALEFNGLFWHSEKYVDANYHYDKFKDSAEKGIQLIQIWEDDWLLKRDIVEGHVKQVLGVSDLPKIAARKTDVKVLLFSEARDFLDQYHIQGSANGSVYLGLLHKEELVAVAVLKNRGSGDYELVRYATSANVQGGHSKLVKYFERNYEYDKLITFADLTFGNGNLYRSTGWTEDLTLPPDYSYIVEGVREHKFNYRKKRFKEDPELEYVEGLTERELAQLNGMTRIYDAGKIRFIKPRPSDTT